MSEANSDAPRKKSRGIAFRRSLDATYKRPISVCGTMCTVRSPFVTHSSPS